MNDEQDDCIWIKTSPTVDGSAYVVNLEFSSDRAITVDRDAAMRYAAAVLAAAARAEFDATVFKQMCDKPNAETASQLISDIRQDRPPLDSEATAPMRLDPGVTIEGKPFLALFLNDKQVGQWDSVDARQHALAILEAVEIADLDAGYLRTLTGVVGISREIAYNVVDDLANYRPEITS